MVSFGSSGGSKNKSKNSSSTRTDFPKDFFNDAADYFGKTPDYDPEYVGFGDEGQLDQIEQNHFNRQKVKAKQGYDDLARIQNEELSNSGLLNSPSKYIEGGARDTLNRNYIQALQQAGNEAALARLGVQQGEAARRTAWNEQRAMAVLNAWLNRLGLAATAGRTGESSGFSRGSTDGGFEFGILSS